MSKLKKEHKCNKTAQRRFQANRQSDIVSFEPIEIYKFVFNIEIPEIIITETERYAAPCNHPLTLMPGEIVSLIGILLLTAYNSQPRQRMY